MQGKTKKLVRGAVAVALATILSMITIYKLPNGGSVTAASMVPIIYYAYLYGAKWGMLTSMAYALIQMIMGFYPPPTPNLGYFALVILLDYVIAFGVMGLSGVFGKPFGKLGLPVGGAIAVALRFVCHFLSGILIWAPYAPEGMPVWLYSLTYNGSYMGLELIITVVVTALLTKFVKTDRILAAN